MVQTYRQLSSQGFCGSGENGFLFSGSWGALLVILGDMGSTGNYFRELGRKFIALGI